MKKLLVQYGKGPCEKCGHQAAGYEWVKVEHGIEDVQVQTDRVIVNGIEGPVVFFKPVGFIRVREDGEQERGSR